MLPLIPPYPRSLANVPLVIVSLTILYNCYMNMFNYIAGVIS